MGNVECGIWNVGSPKPKLQTPNSYWPLERGEVAFGFEGGDASGAGSDNGLAVVGIVHVASGEDTGRGGVAVGGVCGEVAGLLDVNGVGQELGVGGVTNGNKEGVDGFNGDGLCLEVLDVNGGNLLGGDIVDVDDGAVPGHGDIGVVDDAVGHDGGGAQFVAAVNHGDGLADAREEESIFACGIATANDGDVFTSKECPITGCASGDAFADEGLFGGEAEVTGGGTSGDDDGFGFEGGGGGLDKQGLLAKINAGDLTHVKARAEAFGLALHGVHELKAVDAILKARKILDLCGLGEQATGGGAFDNQWREASTS